MVSSSLAARYRPQSFADVVGQPHIVPVLKSMVREDDVPSALLFSGSRGTGKTTCGRIFAAALNAPDESGDVDHDRAEAGAILSGNSPALVEIDAASNGLVDDVRSLRDLVSYSHMGRWRVVLLDEAQSMSNAAFNALLKVLEEPPPRTAFVLLTTEPSKIIETVRSRTMEFDFRHIAPGRLVERLSHVVEAESIDIEEDVLHEIAQRASGGLRDALMELDHAVRLGVKDTDSFRESFGVVDVSLSFVAAAIKGDFLAGVKSVDKFFSASSNLADFVRDLTNTLRDAVVLSSGGTVDSQTRRLEALTLISHKVPAEKLVSAMHVVWDLSARSKSSYDERRALVDLAFAKLVSVFNPPAQLSAPITKESKEPETLSLTQMASMMKE